MDPIAPVQREVAYLSHHVPEELASVPFAAGMRLGANVDEVVTVIVTVSHDLLLGAGQKGQHLLVVAPAAFLGELEVELQHTAPEHGPPSISVASRKVPTYPEEERC